MARMKSHFWGLALPGAKDKLSVTLHDSIHLLLSRLLLCRHPKHQAHPRDGLLGAMPELAESFPMVIFV